MAYAPRAYRITPALVESMEAMAENREEWARCAERAREKVYELTDFGHIVRRYETIIEEVVREQRR